jgi:hypothetical protein
MRSTACRKTFPTIFLQMITEPTDGDLPAVFRNWPTKFGEHVRDRTNDYILLAQAFPLGCLPTLARKDALPQRKR